MELVELTLSNFKKFADGRFGFCPGLNLIWGRNESGKSTIHEAICCALFGRERGQTVENWNGGPCSVALTYSREGRLFRIERHFTDGVSRLGALVGDDLADAVSDKAEMDRLLTEHLGITSKSVFDNTVSVRQMKVSLADVADMEAVGSEIQRVLTGTAHISAAEALKRLEAGRGDVKGRARPTNPREYDRISERLRSLAKELADARSLRDHIRNLEEELESLEARIARDSDRQAVLESLLERHVRWTELRKIESERDSLHKSVFTTLKKLKETLADLNHVQKELEGYADLVGKDEDIDAQLSRIESRRSELESRLAELEPTEEKAEPARPGLRVIALLAAGAALGLAGIAIGLLFDERAFILLAPAVFFVMKYRQARAHAAGAGTESLVELAASARSDLKQLETEEKAVLNYVKCRSIEKARAKIKTYRGLAARARELEVTLKALLGGRKLQDWEAQEADLARELSTTRRELEDEFRDYSPTTEESESWRSEYAALQNSLPSARDRLHRVRGSLEAERRNARDVAALEGEIEYLHMRRNELDFLYRAYDEAIETLADVTQMVSEEYLPELSELAAESLEKVTSGRYTSIIAKPGWEISVDSRDRSAVKPSELSIGTLDQLYFALRIACGRLLSGGRKLPIILDDPFLNFDRVRLDNVLALLETMTGVSQLLLMTHDPYILEWGRRLASTGDIPCRIYELPEPVDAQA